MDLHGGNIYKHLRESGRQMLDYSSNINPLGVSKNLKKQLRKNLDILTTYPDPYYIELRKSIANFNDINIENVIVGNGATEILFLFIRGIKPKNVLLVSPTFSEYERALKTVKAKISYFKVEEKKDFHIDVENLIEKLKKNNYDLIVMCNPNNPTGKFLELDRLKKLIDEVDRKKTLLFLDETFIEFIEKWREKTALNIKSKNVFIMRALTKFFAIPGLRLGYGLCTNENILKKMNSEKEPWSVNNFASMAASILLSDKEYIDKSYKWIKKEKKFLFNKLIKIKNIKVYETETNFILIKLLDRRAENLCKKMEERNILIRNASNFKFLNENYIRIAIKDRKNNKIFLKCFAQCLEVKE